MSQRIHKQAVLLMMLFDIITIITSYVIANYIRFKDIHHNVTPQGYLDIMWVFVIVYLLISLFSTNTRSVVLLIFTIIIFMTPDQISVA